MKFAEAFDRDLDCVKAQFHWASSVSEMILLCFFLITSIFFLIYWVIFELKGWRSEVTKRPVWILGSITYQLPGIRRVSWPLCASWLVSVVTCFNLREVLTTGPERCKCSVFAVLVFYYSRDKAFGHAVVFSHWIDSCGVPLSPFSHLHKFSEGKSHRFLKHH